MKRLLSNGPLWLDLLISGFLPWLIYRCVAPHQGEVAALWWSAAPPAVLALIELVVTRRVDMVSALSLGGIAVCLCIDGLGGDPRMVLVRESMITGALGLIGLSSLAWRRPAAFHLARAAAARANPRQVATFDAQWRDPSVRSTMRAITAIWSGGMVGEAVLRSLLAWRMPVGEFLALSPFVQYGTMTALFGWTLWYSTHRRTKANHATSA